MIGRLTIAAFLFCMPLVGQDWPEIPEIPEIPDMAEMVAMLEMQQMSQEPKILELRDYHGKFQGVVVHRMDVEPQATLIMDDLSGDIVLLGTDVHRIVIEENITIKTHDKERAREIIEEARGTLSAVEKGQTYVFKAKRWGGWEVSSDYKVRVPTTFNVIVATYGGDIDLADLSGDLEAKTGGGDVALSGIQGRIMIKTGGGDIDAFKTQGQMELITGGGDIDSRSVEGKINASTGGGDIDFQNGKGSLDLKTGGGDITIQIFEGSKIEARTGGGDILSEEIIANINILTKGGDICAHGIRGNLEAASSGGDLCLEHMKGDAVMFTGDGDADIDEITGALKVRTGNGDIYVESMYLKDPGKTESSLVTGYGDVYIELDTYEPVDISIRILGYPPRLATQMIDSDVDLNYLVENGNTLATHKTDNPYHSIHIETGDGEIEIIRGD
jgi:DUF4097 and DUF4098 domain-containing protein YvlB